MYSGDRLKEKLGGFLKIAVILFMVYVIGYIGLMFVNRVDASDEVEALFGGFFFVGFILRLQ